MLRSATSGGSMAGQSHQNIAEMIKLLESSSISVTEQTCTLVRDSLSSNADPLLVNELVDHYMTSGSTVIRTLLVGVRSPHFKHFLVKLDEYLQKPVTRYAALNLMGHVVRKDPSWLHQIVQSRAFTTVIKCLQLDNDITVLTIAMYVIATLLPKVPTQIAPNLNHLFGIFIRLVSWKTIRGVDASEMNFGHFQAALFSFFLSVYGMYPCSLIECLQNYYCQRKQSDSKPAGTPTMKYATSPGEEQVLMERRRYEIFKTSIVPLLRKVRLNPYMIMYSKDNETTSDKWRKMEPHDIVTDISQIFIGEKDYTRGDTSSRSNTQTTTTPDEANGELRQIVTDSSDEAVWSPSMVIGLSTPPSSRGMSPTRELADEYKSSSEKSRKPRPNVLNLPFAGAKTANTSTPCTPTMPSQLFDFEKSDSDNESIVSAQSGALTTPKEIGTKFQFNPPQVQTAKTDNLIPDFSPALQPIADSAPDKESRSCKTADTLFIETDKPAVQNLLNVSRGDKAESKRADILENELRLSIQAGAAISDVDWQHFGRGPLAEKESKRLLSGYLQLQCALLFEKHCRQQHATKARRLMRKIYESSALSKRNEMLMEILSEKDAEICKLQATAESLRADKLESEARHRTAAEVLKRDSSRNAALLKTAREDIEKLQREKVRDEARIAELSGERKDISSRLIKAELRLEHETRNKETNEALKAQVFKLQKDLLLAEELNAKVEIMQENDGRFRNTKANEYEMLIRSYQNENAAIKEQLQHAARARDLASLKAVDTARMLKLKDSLLEGQKKYLENVKSLARSQIQAIQSKYQAQKSVVSQMEIQIMDLFAKVTALEGGGDSGSYSDSGQPMQKALRIADNDSELALGACPELSPPLQMGASPRTNVATLELEASTISDRNN